MFLPFTSTAFRRGEFTPRPQCLALTPLPLGVSEHHMLHKPIQGTILVAVKVRPEIVAISSYMHSTCSLILTISRVCLEVRIDLFFSLLYFFWYKK